MTKEGQIRSFIVNLNNFYCKNKRDDMPWRHNTSPYYVFVSEIMLQQTQVGRVKPKFEAFVARFASFYQLANASQKDILKLWQGLGYNRRALNMHKSAQIIVGQYSSKIPNNKEKLIDLPGIGEATAGAIVAYAFNKPVIFIETNIRRALIHYFCTGEEKIDDKELLPILEQLVAMLETPNSSFTPRTFYWAITDYGAYLKTVISNPNVASKHYTLQTKFTGSLRQLRGEVLKYLLSHKIISTSQINKLTNSKLQQESVDIVVSDLVKEGFIVRSGEGYILK